MLHPGVVVQTTPALLIMFAILTSPPAFALTVKSPLAPPHRRWGSVAAPICVSPQSGAAAPTNAALEALLCSGWVVRLPDGLSDGDRQEFAQVFGMPDSQTCWQKDPLSGSHAGSMLGLRLQAPFRCHWHLGCLRLLGHSMKHLLHRALRQKRHVCVVGRRVAASADGGLIKG